MANTKNTKRALLASTLALILCFSMLLGTTYAWFTDSVTSANNIITAGNLDIELEYAKVVDGQMTEWKTVQDDDKIFDPNALWEPGRYEVVYLRVKNLGSLALKYQLSLNVYNEVAGVNVYGEEFKLSDYLVFATVEETDALTTYADREAALAATNGKTMGMKDYNGKTTALEVGGVDYVSLIVYMPTEVGNAANYKTGTTVPSIEFGINLVATQQAAEEDSFGTDYDADAWADGMKVYAADDIVAALANGKNVVLMNDIAATEVIAIADDALIDLNGKTLTANLSVAADAEVVINNGKITTASPSNSAIETVGNLTLNDVEITSDRHGVRVEGGVTVINDGYYKAAGYAGRTQYAVNVSDGGKVIINGGTFVGPKGTASDSGGAVSIQAGSECVINGGDFSGGKSKTLSVSGTLTVYGGTFDQDPTAYIAEGYTVLDNNDGTFLVYFPQTSVDSILDNAVAGDTVQIPAGTYTFTASKIKEGMVIECAPGTVFKGQSSLNIKGATVIGATFSNPSGSAVKNTVNGTFKDCTFTGSNALRSCYTGENVVFENCVFSGDVYGVHFDGNSNDISFKDCTFSGFNALAAAISLATYDNCTFVSNGRSGYNGLNAWGNTAMTDCTFVFDGSAANEWFDLCGANKTATFTNCVVTDGTNTKSVADVVSKREANATLIVDGKQIVRKLAHLQYAVDNAADGAVIGLGANITGDVKITQKADVKFTLDGNGKTFNGVMTVFGNGRKATAALTIKNINFVAANGASSCIVSPDRSVNNAYSYSSNVTVDNCTFTDPDGVVNCAAVRHEDGGDSNWKIVNCVVDNTMHSLIQTNNVELDGLTIQGCKVYSKNGINLNQCTKVSIIDCIIDVKGYAVRYGVAGATVNGTFEITGSTLKSANNDGDAVIIFRGTMTGSTLTLVDTTITGSPEISGNANVVR